MGKAVFLKSERASYTRYKQLPPDCKQPTLDAAVLVVGVPRGGARSSFVGRDQGRRESTLVCGLPTLSWEAGTEAAQRAGLSLHSTSATLLHSTYLAGLSTYKKNRAESPVSWKSRPWRSRLRKQRRNFRTSSKLGCLGPGKSLGLAWYQLLVLCFSQLPEEALLGNRLDSHDWEKISNINVS